MASYFWPPPSLYSAKAISRAFAQFDTLNLPDRSDSDYSLFDSSSSHSGGQEEQGREHAREHGARRRQPPQADAHPAAHAKLRMPDLLANMFTRRPSHSSLPSAAGSAAAAVAAHPPASAPPATSSAHLLPLGASKVSFAHADPASFLVRCGPDYARLGNKLPSLESLYELVAVDLLRHASSRIQHAGKLLALPELDPQVRALASKLSLPPVFVCNFQLPSKASMFSSSPDFGTSLVLVFALRRSVDAGAPAVKLLQRFHANKLPGRFKVIGFVDNLKDLGVPSLIAGFNGKPFMVEKTGRVYREPGHLEMDVDVHQFPILARKTLVGMKSSLPKAQLRVGIVLQGEADHELPERLLGAAAISGMNLDACLDVTLGAAAAAAAVPR